MKRFALSLSFFAASISVLLYTLSPLFKVFIQSTIFKTPDTSTVIAFTSKTKPQQSMNAIKGTMSKTLSHAKITPHLSSARGHSDHGWLNTYHSFSFADWFDPRFTHFGSLRVLNEDRVKPNSGFPTHPHRDFEIFSYILSGELTHRDSMLKKGAEEDGGASSDKFYRMRRGDVQFTTGGTGIAHSEQNEHRADTVHFLQIWAIPWKRGLPPRYHTRHFADEDKRRAFVPILSPLKGGPEASSEQEAAAEPTIEGTIPIHADFVMGAGIIAPQQTFEWLVGAKATADGKRKVYVHVPMTKGGRARVRLDGRADILSEGDGAFVEGVAAGDRLAVESVGEVEAEVVVLDTA
ncbi:RmlC-like cupin domain-containing protein [Biscogniauxia sp. FL1348]|nr:RmlC-like cupin domain-containing protein [Biscogniauxia sp. FL1348]